MSNHLESLKYSDGKLTVIDQLKLPTVLEVNNTFVSVISFTLVISMWMCALLKTLTLSSRRYTAINLNFVELNKKLQMQVRGAPLIAIVAALGLAVDVRSKQTSFTSADAAKVFLLSSMAYLRQSRPTAVNLFVATDELRYYCLLKLFVLIVIFSALVEDLAVANGATSDDVCNGYISAAEAMLEADIACNKAMGDHGAKRILELISRDKIRVLTICNTGSLATAGYGTALGVVRSLHKMGKLQHVYACETRPYNQGARLTAFEIVQDQLPGTLIADSMASYLMAVKGVDCVVVGADRVAANGDTANKVRLFFLL